MAKNTIVNQRAFCIDCKHWDDVERKCLKNIIPVVNDFDNTPVECSEYDYNGEDAIECEECGKNMSEWYHDKCKACGKIPSDLEQEEDE